MLAFGAMTRAQSSVPPQGGGSSDTPARVSAGPGGRLVYTADARGNRTIDFSHAGFAGGGVPIPDVPARILVHPADGDDRLRIQAAIDAVSAMPLDAAGTRGAVLLAPGTYEVDGQLRVAASGVVLRGAGTGPDRGTTLLATGTSRRALLLVAGNADRRERSGTQTSVADSYVPAGARTLTLEDASRLRAGDRVLITRPSVKAWISLLGMDTFPGWRPENRLHWQPGSRDLTWDRTIVAVDGARASLDAPLTAPLDRAFGGGTVAGYEFPGRISRAGVERISLVSATDASRPLDEDHAWDAIALDHVEDAWVRQVSVRHFVNHAVDVRRAARAVTIEDVESVDPVSEVGGWRRRIFHVEGELALFQRCTSRGGTHDFAVGHTAAGPNVFLDSRTDGSLDFSGTLGSWSPGVLFDALHIRGNALRLANRGVDDQGAGWTTGFSVAWNVEATDVEVWSPPGAVNQAYGSRGTTSGDGIVEDPRVVPYRDFFRGQPVEPRSLYRAQLEERLGASAVAAIARREIGSGDQGARPLSEADVAARAAREAVAAASRPLRVEDGAFVIEDARAWTHRTNWSWFQAQMPPSLAPAFGPAITRFAPGRDGRGLTDDLQEVVSGLPPGGAFYQFYGLWYDRRRVNHNYDGSAERRTGDVWAPFVELPWARSGQGKAWDGLSKYDLARFNPWYFDRVREFARLADREGRILYYNFYFQHWLTESRSHYVDFPWRPVNALQDTGLPNEVPAANTFYDLTSPVRRDLHRRYIRHALDTIGGHSNVVFGIDREYTGSLEFLQFWLDEIAAWESEHGRRVFVALEVPKDQMDAVLRDPVRGPRIAAIDFHHWLYRADGRLFAVKGGLNRAPREQRPDIAGAEELEALKRQVDPAKLNQGDFRNGPEFQRLFDTLWAGSRPMKYRAWREYRDGHPQLVVLTAFDEYPELTRAVEQALPPAQRAGLAASDLVRSPRESAWCAARPGEAYLVYAIDGSGVQLDLHDAAGRYTVAWLDTGTGMLLGAGVVTAGSLVTLTPPAAVAGRPTAAWLSRTAR